LHLVGYIKYKTEEFRHKPIQVKTVHDKLPQTGLGSNLVLCSESRQLPTWAMVEPSEQ